MTRVGSLLAAAFAVVVSGCAGLPSLEDRTATTALVDTANTRLGRALAADVAAHPGRTGIYGLPNPHEAFAARQLLTAAAEKSIDVQYFVWEPDDVGYLLFDALWQAADRGVRVRLLLDDYYTRGLDPIIATLTAHPNIEVRLYNPFVRRGARALDLMTDFARLNRRMHNKSFTVDSQVSIVGGRNVGNEYFDAHSGVAFVDLDVIAVGAVVSEIAKEFDLYWNSASAYPASGIVGPAPAGGAADFKSRLASMRSDPESLAYLDAVRETPVVPKILDDTLDFDWVSSRLLYDNPDKTLNARVGTESLLLPQLVQAMGPAEKSLDLVSPYFVPGAEGTEGLIALARRGVKVRILTNSLASNDVKAVHSGYAKRRSDLLRAGVALYELKPTAALEPNPHAEPLFASGSPSALHAKTMDVDRERAFVGSFNLDPRSMLINTEMGLVIDSPKLARRFAQTLDAVLPQIAYEVRLAPDGQSLVWVDRTAAGAVRYTVDPGTSPLLRFGVDLLGILPIEGLL